MLATSSALETKLATRLDRWMDRAVSSQSCDAACEASFGATAGSAPPNRELGALICARRDRRSAACAPSRPPTPNHWIGWPGSGFFWRRFDGAVSAVQGGGAEPAVGGEGGWAGGGASWRSGIWKSGWLDDGLGSDAGRFRDWSAAAGTQAGTSAEARCRAG